MRCFSIIVLSLILLAACKKEEGLGGKKEIGGTVLYRDLNGNEMPAPSAWVKIYFGSSVASGDADLTISCDASGMFNIKGFSKGEYFFDAGFTDSNGFEYNTAGIAVEINNMKNSIDLNFLLE